MRAMAESVPRYPPILSVSRHGISAGYEGVIEAGVSKVSFSQIRAFNAVAREGSVSRAARRLGVSQPAISAQIRALEKDFGVLLFERTGNGVRLTALARTLLAQTESIDGVEALVADVLANSRALHSGELRIAAGAPNPAMSLIAEYRRRYPGVQVTATFGNWAQVSKEVLEKRCDVAVLTGAPDDARLSVTPLVDQRIVALVPKGHRLAYGASPVPLRELARERVIFRTAASLTQRTIDACLAANRISIDPVLVLEAREAVLEAVAQGLGIGFMFDLAVTRIDGVVHMPIEELPQTFSEDVFCLKANRRRRAVSALFDLAEEIAARP